MRPPLRTTLTLAAATALLAASGCAASGHDTAGSAPAGPAPSSAVSPGTTPSGAAPESPTAGPTGGGATLPADLRTRPAVAAAIADLARRKGADPSQVVIAAWSPVTWTDGSLGCPRRGMTYTQALVEGELLMLRVDTGLFQYHAGPGGGFAYCANPSAAYTVGG